MVTLVQGQKLGGRYQILQELGRGAFGVTFVAEDMQRPRNPQCVVKQFEPQAIDPMTLRLGRRFFDQEAEILEQLGTHDQIPRLLAHFEENQEFYIIQEYIEGHDLSKEIFPGKKQSEAYTIKLLQDILEVLAFVHQHNAIHRDIKPSNIRRRHEDGKIVLIDFGAVKQISTQVVNPQGQTAFTVAIGTNGYMPCEQANRNSQLGSDIYAVGIICIQALTGKAPLDLQKDSQIGEIVWRNQAIVSPELADILDKMVRYDFRQRYQSATDALLAFRALPNFNNTQTQNQTIVNPNPSTLPPSNLTQISAPPKKFLMGSGVVAVLATGIGIWYFSQSPTPIQTPMPTPNLLTYNNPNLRIKMKYPENWERQDINNPITGEVVAFLSPKQSDTDNFQEKVTITVEDFSGTLKEYRDLSIQEIQKQEKMQKIAVKIENPIDTTFANKLGKQLVFTLNEGKNSFKNLQVFTLKQDKAFVIIYTAKKDSYNKFLPTATMMVKSFQVQ